jgi:hypothetical protein
MFINYHCPEILYQSNPHPDRYFNVEWHQSWTYSRLTYQNAARREYHLLLANYREANHILTIGYRHDYFIQELIDQFSLIKEYLQAEGIVAYHVAEITRDNFGNPVNQIHYHFLVEYYSFKHRLIRIFKNACRYAGLEIGKDCRVLYEPIPDSVVYERKCRYVLKYKTYKKRAILFRPKTRIKKIGMINKFFINADDTKANKENEFLRNFYV